MIGFTNEQGIKSSPHWVWRRCRNRWNYNWTHERWVVFVLIVQQALAVPCRVLGWRRTRVLVQPCFEVGATCEHLEQVWSMWSRCCSHWETETGQNLRLLIHPSGLISSLFLFSSWSDGKPLVESFRNLGTSRIVHGYFEGWDYQTLLNDISRSPITLSETSSLLFFSFFWDRVSLCSQGLKLTV
jgi:hypothetical protein